MNLSAQTFFTDIAFLRPENGCYQLRMAKTPYPAGIRYKNLPRLQAGTLIN